MMKDFRIPKGRASIILQYVPDDFLFAYFWTNTVTVRARIVSLSGQLGTFYFFFGFVRSIQNKDMV